jgi:hypothetical protein
MSAADALRDFLVPLLGGWRIQFGRWVDAGPAVRYAVIKPAGGVPAEVVRRPQFTLTLIGAQDDDAQVPHAAADTVIEAMRESSGSLVFLQAGEPAHFPTDDGRSISEIAISAITN